ncbi:MAG: hypothetical protein AAF363_00810 [Bacteroidota bacterium]
MTKKDFNRIRLRRGAIKENAISRHKNYASLLEQHRKREVYRKRNRWLIVVFGVLIVALAIFFLINL